MKITEKTINYVSALAKLELTEQEKQHSKEDLGRILEYMERINDLDTTGVLPMSHIVPRKNVFREDIVKNVPDRENLLANAPAKKDGCFMVPKTVE